MIAMWNVTSDIRTLWDDLNGEMDEFRALTDDLWRDMLYLSTAKKVNRHRRSPDPQYSGYGGSSGPQNPQGSNDKFPSGGGPSGTRPVGVSPPSTGFGAHPPGGASPPDQCKCKLGSDNKCPQGPAGPKGLPGVHGRDAHDGLDGIPGVDAQDVEPDVQSNGACFNCPAGPQGPPGPNGKTSQQKIAI